MKTVPEIITRIEELKVKIQSCQDHIKVMEDAKTFLNHRKTHDAMKFFRSEKKILEWVLGIEV